MKTCCTENFKNLQQQLSAEELSAEEKYALVAQHLEQNGWKASRQSLALGVCCCCCIVVWGGSLTDGGTESASPLVEGGACGLCTSAHVEGGPRLEAAV